MFATVECPYCEYDNGMSDGTVDLPSDNKFDHECSNCGKGIILLAMFLYNWQVREDWFKWCKSLSLNELHAERIGGMGSILKTLIHVIDCELLWINYMLEEPHNYPEKISISNLDDVKRYSIFTKTITETFLSNLTNDYENKQIHISSKGGTSYSFTYGKIIRHLITHEVHHIGQLSIWSRELGLKPISSDLIVRQYA